jgi:NodT family efflux transporter outer membrane factor (OMF) lipoprotein
MRTLLVLAAAVALAGCALKKPPDPVELRKQALPNLQIPETWASHSTPGGGVQEGWLASFNDSKLNLLVQEALEYNADLRVAGARVEQAAGYARVAAAGMYPVVNLLARGGGAMSGDNSGLQGAALAASWELDVWGRVRYGRAAAAAQYSSAIADLEYARQSLVALVAKSWFLATEAKIQRQVAQDAVLSAESLVSLAKDRERVGRGDAMDVANAEANLETYRDTLRQLDLSYQQSVRALEILLGRYPAAQLDAPGDLPAMPPPIPAGLPSELLERRPDVIAAERRVAAAFNRTGEAQAARLPSLSLTASINSISSDLFVLQDRDNPVWSVGANLIAPIYQGGALKAQVEIRTAEQQQAVAEFARVALRAFGDVENALAGEIAFQEREQILLRAATQSERALGLARIAFNVGSIDLRPVQQQQLALYATRSGLVRVQSEQRLQRVNLHLALGGGWGLNEAQADTSVQTNAVTTAMEAAPAQEAPEPDAAMQDRTEFTREGDTWFLNIYREKGIGGVEVSAPRSGWPKSLVVRFHAFPTLESFTARSAAAALLCETQQREGRPAEFVCTLNGVRVEALRSSGDQYEVTLPAAMLAASTTALEVRWVDQWR